MKKDPKKFFDIFIRYFILLLIAFPNLYFFYLIFTPLTLYPVYFLINLFFDVSLNGTSILINSQSSIDLIPACIAGSAYYLLLILNLSLPNVKNLKRIKMVVFSFLLLLVINILRIFILSLFVISDSFLFDVTHKFFWYFMSTIFIILIWFLEVKLFKIKEIPFYSDLKFLYKKSYFKKK